MSVMYWTIINQYSVGYIMNTTDWFVLICSKNIILLQNALPVHYGFLQKE
jgi:hypothetical protein